MSIVLIPKTFFYLCWQPVKMAEYVEKEVKSRSPKKFDAFSHPITYFVVVGVFPVLAMIPAYIRIAEIGTAKVVDFYNAAEARGAFPVKIPKDFFDQVKQVIIWLKALSWETEALVILILLGSWPVATAAIIRLFRVRPKSLPRKKKPVSIISNEGLKAVLFTQCYGYASFYLVYFSGFSTVFILMDFPPRLTAQICFLFFPQFYFAACEVLVIRHQTERRMITSLGIGIVAFAAGMACMMICEVVVFLPLILSHMR